MTRADVSTSKFLSLVLRHRPEVIGLTLDAEGWAEVDALIRRARAHGRSLSRTAIERVVATNDKQRFALSADGAKIRARQGHSIPVALGLAPVDPPALLYHGTAAHALASIRAEGLRRGRRQHVHLSPDRATALRVGQRHGRPVVLVVASGAMCRAGYAFFRSENGVWLTDHVPPAYLTLDAP